MALSLSEQAAQLIADPLELAPYRSDTGPGGQRARADPPGPRDDDGRSRLHRRARPTGGGAPAGGDDRGRPDDDALAGKAFTRLCAITSPGEAAILTARDPAVSAVEMLMRTHEWALSVRNGSGPRQDTLNAAVYANLSGDYDAARDLD